MGFGIGIFLLVIGAILAFAVNASVSGLDIQVIGWILIGAGVLDLIIMSIFWSRRRQAVATATPVAPVAQTYVDDPRL